ncbi:MAG: cyclic nucleotide-binding domain-containing protein, partial [Clostridia bacterium]|nr:cyclic nucleotide-binding domain-containing protein [Clostridia bacterium]
MNEEILSLLESSAPFSSLSREELLALLPEVRQKTYRPGAFVLRQGTPSLNHLFLVAAGRAEIVVSGDGGMETVVGQRRRGEVFGETVILTGKSYPASVRAAEELTCLVFTRHRIEELLLRNPGFASFFSQLLAERLRELYGEALKEQAYDAYRSDYFLFQQRITGLVARPVITCRIDQTVTDVSQIMARHGVGAILVMEGETLRGAITERDLVQKVLSRGADPQKV